MRTRFYASGLYISPLAPLLLGFVAGMLTILLGVGGGFILVPAMIYLLGMATQVVVGTSLFQILFVTAAATMVHATTTKAVDIVLAALLLLGVGRSARRSARGSRPRCKPEYLRLALAVIVLLVGLRMLLGLAWRPDEIFTVELSVKSAAGLSLLARAAADGREAKPVLVPDVSQRRYRDRATASPAPNCCCSARSFIPADGCPTTTSRPTSSSWSRARPSRSWCARRQKVAGIWVNADAAALPLGAELLRDGLVAADRAARR